MIPLSNLNYADIEILYGVVNEKLWKLSVLHPALQVRDSGNDFRVPEIGSDNGL